MRKKFAYIQLAKLDVEDFIAITDILLLNGEKISKTMDFYDKQG